MRRFTLKKVENCIDCRCKLSKNHKHHFRCNKCWFENKSKICNGSDYIKDSKLIQEKQ